MRRVILYKALVASLMLALLHSNAAAQDEEGVGAITTADSTYDEETADEELPAPDTAVYRQVPDTVINRLQKTKDFAYANNPAYWIRQKPPEQTESWFDRLLSQVWLKYLVLLVMSAILLYALIKIVVSNKLLLFRSTPSKMSMEEEQDLLKKDNLGELIAEAEQAGNFRLSVRYRYMKTLQDMEHRNLIQLSAKSTNWEYVNKLGSHPLKKQFQLLTRAYEYVWYGEFDLNAEQYGYLRTEFQKFENSL